MSITAKELAEKLGISASAVSIALNGKKGISDEKRDFILRAAKEYGLKRPLRKSFSSTFINLVIFKKHGMVYGDTPFFAAVTEGKTATEEEPIDVSAVMSNPSFSDNTANGWTLTHTGGSLGGKADQLQGSTAYEIWNGTAFDIHQTVPGLPEGYYRLSVKALFRNGNNSDDLAAAYFAAPDSPEQNLAQFYANEQAVNVKNAYAEAQAEDPAIDGQITFNKDGQVLYTPNTMISFEEYAMTLGLYTNQIVMGLDGKKALTLGLRFEGAAANSWFPFDDFKIEYLGTKAPTAVEGILTDMTEGIKAIYDLSGRRVSKAVKGIYIINGKKVVK